MATGNTDNSIDSKEQLMLVQHGVPGSGNFGGYKQNLLVNTLNEMETEFYVCTQCRGVMRNASQFGAEQYLVCETCAENKHSILPMMKVRKKIFELKANCPLATRGCEWNATLSEVDTHLDECQEFLVKCKLQCGTTLKGCELENHFANECLNREVSCEHCHYSIVFKELIQHYGLCLEYSLVCPNACGATLIRKQMSSHIETNCPNTIVSCQFERFGCKEVVKRCEVEEHKEAKETKHLEMTSLFALNDIEQLQETNSKLSKEVMRLNDRLQLHDSTISQQGRTAERGVADTKALELAMKQQFSQMKFMIETQSAIIEKQSAMIESVSYPVVLRDTIKSDFKIKRTWSRMIPLAKFEILWRSINMVLLFKRPYGGYIPASVSMKFNEVMSPQLKWPFQGRFKLTIVNKINPTCSLVYESSVVDLQPKQHPELGFNLVEDNPDNVRITEAIPRKLLEDTSRKEGEVEFTLQIQVAEHVRIVNQI